jgi:hypothetical protein
MIYTCIGMQQTELTVRKPLALARKRKHPMKIAAHIKQLITELLITSPDLETSNQELQKLRDQVYTNQESAWVSFPKQGVEW